MTSPLTPPATPRVAPTASTPLHAAFDRYAVAPDHPGRRVAFLGAFLRAELFMVLQGAAVGDTVEPVVQTVQGGQAVVVFDTLDALAGFAGGQADQITLSGRTLVEMVAGQSLGCVINPGAGDWSYLIDPQTLDWLHDHLDVAPDAAVPSLDALEPATLADLNLVEALDTTLPACRDRADHAIVVQAKVQARQDDQPQLVVFFVDAVDGAEGALSQIIQDMVTFSGTDLPPLAVGFAATGTGLHDRLSAIGLRMDIPQTPKPEPLGAPGSDPDSPPILR